MNKPGPNWKIGMANEQSSPQSTIGNRQCSALSRLKYGFSAKKTADAPPAQIPVKAAAELK